MAGSGSSTGLDFTTSGLWTPVADSGSSCSRYRAVGTFDPNQYVQVTITSVGCRAAGLFLRLVDISNADKIDTDAS